MRTRSVRITGPGCRPKLGAVVATALSALACLAVGSDPAGAYIYWAHQGGFFEGEIGRANLNGRGKDREFIPRAIGPEAVAVDRRHVYWINGDDDSIGRARLDGTRRNQRFIDGVVFARDLVLTRRHLYWTSDQTMGSDASIGRANVDGTGIDRAFIPFGGPEFTTPLEIDVRGGYIYWANAYPTYAIGRARTDGTEVDQRFVTDGVKNPFGLAVDRSHIYWSNRGTRSISRASIDGSNPQIEFIGDTGRVPSLDVHRRFLYWPTPGNRIIRARRNGSHVKTLVHRAAGISVAVDRERRCAAWTICD
jgi:virginiamycin B lyase